MAIIQVRLRWRIVSRALLYFGAGTAMVGETIFRAGKRIAKVALKREMKDLSRRKRVQVRRKK